MKNRLGHYISGRPPVDNTPQDVGISWEGSAIDDFATFSTTATGSGVTYSWEVNGTEVSTSQTATFSVVNDDDILLTVTNEFGSTTQSFTFDTMVAFYVRGLYGSSGGQTLGLTRDLQVVEVHPFVILDYNDNVILTGDLKIRSKDDITNVLHTRATDINSVSYGRLLSDNAFVYAGSNNPATTKIRNIGFVDFDNPGDNNEVTVFTGETSVLLKAATTDTHIITSWQNLDHADPNDEYTVQSHVIRNLSSRSINYLNPLNPDTPEFIERDNSTVIEFSEGDEYGIFNDNNIIVIGEDIALDYNINNTAASTNKDGLVRFYHGSKLYFVTDRLHANYLYEIYETPIANGSSTITSTYNNASSDLGSYNTQNTIANRNYSDNIDTSDNFYYFRTVVNGGSQSTYFVKQPLSNTEGEKLAVQGRFFQDTLNDYEVYEAEAFVPLIDLDTITF